MWVGLCGTHLARTVDIQHGKELPQLQATSADRPEHLPRCAQQSHLVTASSVTQTCTAWRSVAIVRWQSSALRIARRTKADTRLAGKPSDDAVQWWSKRSENLHSVLEDIPGVGSERRKLLLRQFGSLTSLKKASIEDLLHVPGISKKLAGDIHSFLSSSS